MADHRWEKLNEYCESFNPECKNVKKNSMDEIFGIM